MDSGADGLAPAPPRAAVDALLAHAGEPHATSEPARAAEPQARSASVAAALAPTAAPADGATAGEGRRSRLAVVEATVRSCTRCELHASRAQTVFARGNPDAELVFVGEGPGADEDAQGLPFVGRAGQLLDRMIEAMGYRRDEVYVCNVVKCRPPGNRKPTPAEMGECGGYVRQQLAIIDPKVIVALGATAVEGLLGTTVGITRLRGTWKLHQGRTPVMPTFHPAYLLRSPEKKREAWADLQQVMARLGRALPKRGG